MDTYPVLNANGERSSAFEVEAAYASPARIAMLLSEVPGVTGVKRRKPLKGPSEVHVEFNYRGEPFIVWEPFGDNSRYWIGPKEGAEVGLEAASLEEAFKRYRPPLHRALLGDLLTLKFFTKLVRRRPDIN